MEWILNNIIWIILIAFVIWLVVRLIDRNRSSSISYDELSDEAMEIVNKAFDVEARAGLLLNKANSLRRVRDFEKLNECIYDFDELIKELEELRDRLYVLGYGSEYIEGFLTEVREIKIRAIKLRDN